MVDSWITFLIAILVDGVLKIYCGKFHVDHLLEKC